jgi:hypothetical protein
MTSLHVIAALVAIFNIAVGLYVLSGGIDDPDD